MRMWGLRSGSVPHAGARRDVRGSGAAGASRSDALRGPGRRLRGAETLATRRKPGPDLEWTRDGLGAGGWRAGAGGRCGPGGGRRWVASSRADETPPLVPAGQRD